jgi:hypothetical protein
MKQKSLSSFTVLDVDPTCQYSLWYYEYIANIPK